MTEVTLSTVIGYFQQYYLCFSTAIIFLLFMKYNTRLVPRTRKLLERAASLVLLFALSECLERLCGLPDYRVFLRSVLSSLNYLMKPFILVFIIDIAGRHWTMKQRLLNSIPALLNTLICLISIPTGIVCSFNEANQFLRGPLWFIPFVAGGYYLLEYVLFGIVQIRKFESLDGLICLANAASVTVVVILEAEGELIGLLPNVAMISIVFYYITLLLSKYSHDELTGLNLRHRFYADVDRTVKPSFVVSADLNGLKKVNDSQGHAAGDRMLMTFAEAAQDGLPFKARVYRMGGDEFAILYETKDPADVEKLLREIRRRMEGSGVTFAAGFEPFTSKEDFFEAFKRADARMYEEKKASKGVRTD